MNRIDPQIFGEEQTCFGCGPHNERGWRLEFEKDDAAVYTTYTPMAGEDGPPGIFHGGLQATLADEVAGWTLVGLRGRMGFTTSMQVRYMRPCRVGVEIVCKGRIIREDGHSVTVRATLEQEGKVCCAARVVYLLPTVAMAEKTLGQELDPRWRALCRPESAF